MKVSWKRRLSAAFIAAYFGLGGIAMTNAAPAPVDIEIKAREALTADGGTVYPLGETNDAYAKYFTGDTYLYTIAGDDKIYSANVTFEPGVINHWHVHHGSCQILAGASGRGYYQIWGEEAKEILPGETVVIPEGVKHWHGAQEGHWFQHISTMMVGSTTDWLEPVDPVEYKALVAKTASKAQNAASTTTKRSAVKITQTAGRTVLGDFAPEFARYNDDILFGEVWSRNDILSLHDRSIVTVSALTASGVTDSSLKYHIGEAKKNGVTKEEMAEILTQLAFYGGWPKAWAAFRYATEIYADEEK